MFFQAEDGIRDLVRSRGLGDVYKRQEKGFTEKELSQCHSPVGLSIGSSTPEEIAVSIMACLLYTSDAADDLLCVYLGGRRSIQQKTTR